MEVFINMPFVYMVWIRLLPHVPLDIVSLNVILDRHKHDTSVVKYKRV